MECMSPLTVSCLPEREGDDLRRGTQKPNDHETRMHMNKRTVEDLSDGPTNISLSDVQKFPSLEMQERCG